MQAFCTRDFDFYSVPAHDSRHFLLSALLTLQVHFLLKLKIWIFPLITYFRYRVTEYCAVHGAGRQTALRLWPCPRPFPLVQNRVWPCELSLHWYLVSEWDIFSGTCLEVLCLSWLPLRCVLNSCQSAILWLTTARRNFFYQHDLACIYHEYACNFHTLIAFSVQIWRKKVKRTRLCPCTWRIGCLCNCGARLGD